jgi:hypothetical protein
MYGDLTVEMDGVRMEWCRGKRSLGGWHTGASELFSGTQVATNFCNGIQVKDSFCKGAFGRVVAVAAGGADCVV